MSRANASPDIDDFAAFQNQHGNNGEQQNGHQQLDYDEFEEEAIDFQPQNGYQDPPMAAPYFAPDQMPTKKEKVKAERQSREPMKMPKMDIRGKLASVNNAVKRVRMPSPGQIAGGIKESLNQPLAVRTRVEDIDVQKARQMLTEKKTPGQLGNLRHPLDIPIPKLRSSSNNKSKENESEVVEFDPKVKEGSKLYNTLPRSWRTQNLVTSSREITDMDDLMRRKHLVETKSPLELSSFSGFSDIPVPTKVKRMVSPSERIIARQRGGSQDEPRESLYGTLSRSMRETKLVTNTREMEDEEELSKRRELVQSKSPAQLAEFSNGLSDFPVPSRIEKIFKKDDMRPGSRARSESLPKNFSESMYATLPKSWKEQNLITQVKTDQDAEIVAKRRALTQEKTPAELAQISSLADMPIPTALENFLKADHSKRGSQFSIAKKPLSELTLDDMYNTLPKSLKSEVFVASRVIDDPELIAQRQEMVRSKTPRQLAQMSTLDDFPIPTRIENLVKKSKNMSESMQKSDIEDNRALKDKLYDTLPRSMKSEVLVRVRDEDPDIQKQRQELTRSKSPVELSQISSLSDFPIPKNIEDLLNKKKATDDDSGPTPPPRRFRKEDIYESLPASLKTEVLVKTKIEADEQVLKARQELARSKSPAQLSEIHRLEDFPIPTFVENLTKKKEEFLTSENGAMNGDDQDLGTMKRLYKALPDSMKSEVLVRARQEDPEIQSARADICKTKTVAELSQISTLDQFPIPKTVEQLIGRAPRPVERKKKFRKMQRSQSAKNIQERMENALPESLKAKVLVKARVEDEEIRQLRRQLVESKSVSELSQISSWSDFPIPTTIEKLMAKSGDLSSSNLSPTPSFDIHNIYATLPSSLKSEVLVRSRVEDPEILQQRRQVCQSKSVSELSQMRSMSDFPIPTTIERLIEAQKAKGESGPKEPFDPAKLTENIYATLPRSLKSEVLVRTRTESPEVLKLRQEVVQSKSVGELAQVNNLKDFPLPTPIEKLIQGQGKLPLVKSPTAGSMINPETGKYDIYASLPRSLKKEVLVRSKVEDNEEVLKERQAIVSSKSPAELSQIHSFAEVPLPRAVETWLHHQNAAQQAGYPTVNSRSFHELSAGVYESLPRSLKEPTLVRSKVEHPERQRERYELTRSKTPSQLAEIHSFADIPIPGLWERGANNASGGRSSHRTSLSGRSSSIPRNKKELKDMVYNKILPESLTKPCVVRCTTEDPNLLRQRQNLQQSKSIHELSKIRNLNEFPLPGNIRLPDVPLPKVKTLIGAIARVPVKRPLQQKSTAPCEVNEDLVTGYSTVSTPNPDRTYTDDEMLRYEMSSPESMAHREQDFDYEVIESGNQFGFMQTQIDQEEENSISVADHYKGTPPLKAKKGKKNRNSHEIPSDYQVTQQPPPLPPKGIKHHELFSVQDSRQEPRELTEQAAAVGPDCHAPGPKIAYSYQHDPKATPIRKISKSSLVETEAGPTRPQRRGSKDVTPTGRSPDPAGNKLAKSASGASANTMTSLADQWHSVRSTLPRSTTDDDQTLHTCHDDTLVGSDDLHSLSDTLNDPRDLGSDDEFSLEMLPRDRNSRNLDH